MSGAVPPDHDGAGAPDPSMEDILASIRRILNEDEAAAAAPEVKHDEKDTGVHPVHTSPELPQSTNAGGSGGDDGVFLLDEAMLVTTPPPPAPALNAGTVPAPSSPPVAGSGTLLAPEAAAAASQSVESLLRTISTERGTQVHRGGPTIEDLVRDELRPLLKTWLDQHLPPLVERLVRQEIERVIGRAAS